MINWNLPSQLVYAPFSVLSLIIVLTNPESIPRQYSMKLLLWQDGQPISEEEITFDGNTHFQLGGDESAVFYSGVSSPITSAVLEMSVFNDIGECIDSVTCTLIPAVPAATQAMYSLPALFGLAMISSFIIGGG